ncbi:hypothetical protein MARCHEWKA_01990 [Brevundimonas phage vB_BpoS-Marchewka]|uniref:Uncharacterized protein n=1 Tax=Brevundimonas phage vB_BpoS-Marchewka TaxID=2948604 RepID=A0A9E7N544_9CAUD|nr:hypothetical protein MARCHEWKA_01990 [Brevundimonas phage vB_BpoS-Marchewka]UTC29157.1 hypothetical protein BAMBUS_00740 [Brevundimonas phage vB_BpoS-Bambus]
MTKTDKAALWALFGIAVMLAVTTTFLVTHQIMQERADERVADERTLAVKDMAAGVKAVCRDAEAEPNSYPKAFACIGSLSMMLATMDARDKRLADDHAG